MHRVSAVLLAVMALASYRLWRFVGRDQVPGALIGNWLAAHRSRRLFDLLTCPWCLGAWISFAVVAVTAQLVVLVLPVLQALAVACLVGLIAQVDRG